VIEIGPAGNLPPGSQTQLLAIADDTFNQTFARLFIEADLDGDGILSVDVDGIAPPVIEVELRQNGLIQSARSYRPPYPAALVTGPMGDDVTGGLACSFIICITEPCPTFPHLTARLSKVDSFPWQQLGGPLVQANEIIVRIPLPPPITVPIELVSLSLTGLNPLPVTISQEAAHFNNLPHHHAGTPVGPSVEGPLRMKAADLNLDGRCDLALSNIGSSGEDGVSIDLLDYDDDGDLVPDAVEELSLDLAPTELSTLPHHAVLRLEARGEVNAMPNQNLGQAMLRWRPAFFDVFADFSDIGSLTHHLVLLDHGAVVLDLPGQVGMAAQATQGPVKIGKLGGGTECYVMCMPDGNSFLHGGNLYLANEIRLLAETTDALGPKSRFSIRSTDWCELAITGADVGAAGSACPADCALPQNGQVNVNDLLALLAQWGWPGLCDIAPPYGVVNVNDLLALLAAWGACP
jgi:hypothetical protein